MVSEEKVALKLQPEKPQDAATQWAKLKLT